MNDLDWLCRNMHEWPTDKNTMVRLDYDGEVCFGPSTTEFDFIPDDVESARQAFVPELGASRVGKEYTRDQWLTRRAEWQGKPSWIDAPEWAKSLGQDSDGTWVWLPHYDVLDHDKEEWMLNNTRETSYERAGVGEVLGDWRNTLERRPERKPSEKTAKALDESEDIESAIDQPMQDAYKNKPVRKLVSEWTGPEDGLPPVGMECESHLSGSLWEIGCLTYIGNNLIVWKSHTGHEYATRPTDRVFRPLRTEENKAVEEMNRIVGDIEAVPTWRDALRALYRAGYRKLDTPADND